MQLTALKKAEYSLRKWPPKFCSSTTPLHKNGFGFNLLQNNSSLNVPSMASNKLGLYRSEIGYHSPTSSQNLGSKRVQYLPIMAKIHYYRLKNNKQIQTV
jgi:hypothetical protein